MNLLLNFNKKILKKLLVALSSLFFLISEQSPVSAIYNGTSALGSNYVLKIRIGNSYCSAAPLDKYLVVTAAHCVVRNGVAVDPKTILIYPPGVDTNKVSTFAKGIYITYPLDHINSDSFTEPNDIAFIVIDAPFAINVFPKLANYEKTKEIVNSNTPIQVFGYGITKAGGQSVSVPNAFTGIPIAQRRFARFIGFERTYLNFAADERGSTCPGDSGGPSIAEFQGVTYLVSIHSGAGGPCSASITGSMTATISGEYPQIVSKALDFIATQKPSSVSEISLTNIGENGTISWKLKDDELSRIAGVSVLDENGLEICRAGNDKKNCGVFVKPGINKFEIVTLGKLLNSEPTKVAFTIGLTSPINPKISRVSLSGILTWDTPLNFSKYVDYYTVIDSQGTQVCKTNLNSCSIGLLIGLNKFSTVAHFKDVKSPPLDFTLSIKNAQPIGIQNIKTFKTKLEIEWAQVTNFGDVNPSQVLVILQDSKTGEELCTVSYPQKSCLIPLTARDYQFAIALRTDLGRTSLGPIYSFSGIDQIKTSDALMERLELVNTNLRVIAKSKPGNSKEVEELVALSPIFHDKSLVDDTLFKAISDFEAKVMTLIKSEIFAAIDRSNILTSSIESNSNKISKHLLAGSDLIKKFEEDKYLSFVKTSLDLEADYQTNVSELTSFFSERESECQELTFPNKNLGIFVDVVKACNDLENALNFAKVAQSTSQTLLFQLRSLNDEVKILKASLDLRLRERQDAELKAKQEAEARAAAEKAAASKKTTITCIKGKLTKKITAVNPKCPAGYKKR